MNERIWKEPITFAKIEDSINEYIEEQLLKLKDKDILEKWNYLSLMVLEKFEIQQRFLEIVEFIDKLLSVDKNKKIRYILTLNYLVIKEKLKITKMDTNSIFLLVAYLDTVKLKNLKSSLKYLNNEELLKKIRLKSLDLEIRQNIIAYLNEKKQPIKEAIAWIEETEYYELVKMVS